jgi:hypothetical protein
MIDLRLRISPWGSGTPVTISTVRLPNTTNIIYVDLGVISVPFGADPGTDGPSNLSIEPGQYDVSIAAQRVSGSGNIDFDFLLFIPADDQLCVIQVGNDAAGDGYVLDSHRDTVYAVSSGRVDSSADIVPLGALPTLLPGVTNRIYLVQGLSLTGLGAELTNTAPLAVTYWPRYIWVKPVST